MTRKSLKKKNFEGGGDSLELLSRISMEGSGSDRIKPGGVGSIVLNGFHVIPEEKIILKFESFIEKEKKVIFSNL